MATPFGKFWLKDDPLLTISRNRKAAMPIEENKAAVRAYFEQFLNLGDFDAADGIFASEVQFHYPLGDLSGIDAIKNFIAAFRGAFPDAHFTVADLFGERERIAARWSLTGTQTGEFRGKPPTGRRVSMPGNTICSVIDGRIDEMWVAFDPALLL